MRHSLRCALLLCMLLAFATNASAAGLGKGLFHKHVCGAVAGPAARCNADVVTDATGTPLATGAPVSGYGPVDLQSAYGITTAASSQGTGMTVAIVDAYDAPNAESDLATYRSTMSLPVCGSTDGCFHKVNQSGGSTPPSVNAGWAQEISLDIDMVSAICPNCKILLVEASSNSFANLAAAVDRAALMGANAISNSYGGGEASGPSYQSHYDHPGIDITASSGDNGYGVEFPAASPTVTAVGGTHLTGSPSTAWTETAWSGAGSGCSSYFAKPSWQHDTGCANRTVADQSAVADPNTGVAVYDSTPSGGSSGWLVFGGTSVASPIIASLDALAGGRTNTTDTPYGSFPYLNGSLFKDILSGSNGRCGGSYLCTAKAGYDGPTGVGTPIGAAGLTAPTPPVNSTPPSIPGSATVGQTLTANPGVWSPAATSYAYQWQSCAATCATVGSNAAGYTVQSSDLNNTIDVIVTASNSAGPGAAAQSNPTTAVQPAPPPQPDFSIAASPASQSVVHGSSVTYTVTVTPINSFAGPVSLGSSGYPPGSGGSFNPASLPFGSSWTSTLTVTTSSSTPNGSRTITITGTAAGPLSHSTTVTLTVKKK